MIFESLKWLLAVLSIVGVVLNIRHDRRCFAIWLVTNLAWTAVDVLHGVYAQAALQATYAGLAVWGLVKWAAVTVEQPLTGEAGE